MRGAVKSARRQLRKAAWARQPLPALPNLPYLAWDQEKEALVEKCGRLEAEREQLVVKEDAIELLAAQILAGHKELVDGKNAQEAAEVLAKEHAEAKRELVERCERLEAERREKEDELGKANEAMEKMQKSSEKAKEYSR